MDPEADLGEWVGVTSKHDPNCPWFHEVTRIQTKPRRPESLRIALMQQARRAIL